MKQIFRTQAIIYMLCLWVSASVDISAQCNDLTMHLTRTNSTCTANGTIQIALSGPDLNNIRTSDMQFRVSGTLNLPWAFYSGNIIGDLPAGTYTVDLRAFCYDANAWVVTGVSSSISITSSYVPLDAVMGVPRKSLTCDSTGMAPITIMNNTGSSPYMIKVTSYPPTYIGDTIFKAVPSGNAYQIRKLPAGEYTFTVIDNCSYTKTLNVTIDAMPPNGEKTMLWNYLYNSSSPTPGACNIVTFMRNAISSPPDNAHYYYNNTKDYYEIGFNICRNGTNPGVGAITQWYDIISNNSQSFDWAMPSPYTLKMLRDSSFIIFPYLKVKGTSCTIKLDSVVIYNISTDISYGDANCDSISVFHHHRNSNGPLCYPYQWRVIKINSPGDTTFIVPWTGWIDNNSTQNTGRIPYGSRIEYIDYAGTTWHRDIQNSPPTPYLSFPTVPYILWGMTDSIYHSRVFVYFSPQSYFPVGTTVRFISGPTTLRDTIVSQSNLTNLYLNGTNLSYQYLRPGKYKVEITIPGCLPQILTYDHFQPYKLKAPITYTNIVEDCGGLSVYPRGQIVQVDSLGVETLYSPDYTYFRIYSSTPSNIPYNPASVSLTSGTPLRLPTTGEYHIAMCYSNGASPACYDTIRYTKTPFSLNTDSTSAYVCAGGITGYMRIKGKGGSGNYSYELYDDAAVNPLVPVASNNTGIFNYGSAGNSYRIRLIDNDPNCAASYDQNVFMLNLGIAQIAFTNSPMNRFCLSDSVDLKCLTLGQTIYTWSGGPSGLINISNEHKQNLRFAALDIGIGTHTFTVRVTPESCGEEMEQNVTITIEDCSGAHDDHVTVFVNTTDSIDVLDNDRFPLSCLSSLVPVIITPPFHGTAAVDPITKKIVYTPQRDYIGPDRIFYQTTCGSMITTAIVYINVIPAPDNIIDATCFVSPPPPMVFGIKELDRSPSEVSIVTNPLAGDIDGDGETEILVMNYNNALSRTDAIYIYGFNKATGRLYRKYTIAVNLHTLFPSSSLAIAKVDGNPYASIFYADYTNRTLRKYDFNGTIPVVFPSTTSWTSSWSSPPVYSSNAAYTAAAPVITDIMGNGRTQVVMLDKVIDTQTGTIIANGGFIPSSGYSFGRFGHGFGGGYESIPVVIDIDGDGIKEVIGGDCVYGVNLVNFSSPAGNTFTLKQRASNAGHPEIGDGGTAVADIDNDGELEVVVAGPIANNWSGTPNGMLYIYNPRTGAVKHTNVINNINRQFQPSSYYGPSRPFIGDLDNDGIPEIALTGVYTLRCYRFIAPNQLTLLWALPTNDSSGSTTLTVFDFAHDGKKRLVYRDEQQLRIIDGSTSPPTTDAFFNNVQSPTVNEFPIVADINGDGAAEIIVTGIDNTSSSNWAFHGELRVYASNGQLWAPARSVWNQAAYNSLNVNEDLTIPALPISPATVFPSYDGILGTPDDVRPFNGFLMQQTMLNNKGNALWLIPDVVADSSISSISMNGNNLTLTVGIINIGEAAIGPPVHVTLYKNAITSGNIITTVSPNISINPGDTAYITFTADMTPHSAAFDLFIRVNDNGTTFPVVPECEYGNNAFRFPNPQNMTKNASLNHPGAPFLNGFYSNPVAILFGDTIHYEIAAYNANFHANSAMQIVDTLPLYLNYVPNSATNGGVRTYTATPARDIITWNLTGLSPQTTYTVNFRATPQAGVSISQPLFVNRARITGSGSIPLFTNATYHQGAGASLVTFSANYGGRIYNAEQQALDYRTTARSGIVVTPNEGHKFAGWSHDTYISLRGNVIPAQSNIMYYDTLVVYGDVNLQANFELEAYPIRYYLNGGKSNTNPDTYTIESQSITLDIPEKTGDIFAGWTGSNGDVPQMTVTIPKGSTGERTYFANFLRSGRENRTLNDTQDEEDVWVFENVLYIRTSKPGSVVRIYTTNGVLCNIQTILSAGETKIKLPDGIYIVTLNNGIGNKVRVK